VRAFCYSCANKYAPKAQKVYTMPSIATSAEWRKHWLLAYTSYRNLTRRADVESEASDYADQVISALDAAFLTDQNLTSDEHRTAWVSNVVVLTSIARLALSFPDASAAASAALAAMVSAGGTNENTDNPDQIEVLPASTVERYLNESTGSDGNDGLTPATAWQTPQKCLDVVPAGFSGDYVVYCAAGDITASAELKARVTPSARICFVADSAGAAGFDISGQSFAFATNATATATVPAFTSFARGDRWLRPGSFPVDDVAAFGSPEWGGTTLEASTTPVLTATMGDPSVGNACDRVCEYTSQMTCDYFGTKQSRVNLQLVGFDFGSGEITREGCVFVACKATTSASQRNLIGCGGFLSILGKGSFFGAQVSNLYSTSWTQYMGSYEAVLQVRQNVASITLTTAVGDTQSPQAAISAASNALISMNFCDIDDGVGFLVSGNSRAFLTGNVAFNGATICTVDDNSSCEFTGGSYTGSVASFGVNCQKSSRIDDTSQLTSITTGTNDVLCGTLTATFAVGATDTGSALSTVVP
jgi:hypothetical protein